MRSSRVVGIAALIGLCLASSFPAAHAACDVPAMEQGSLATLNQEMSKHVASELRESMHDFRSIDMTVRAKVLCTSKNLTAHVKADGSTVEAASVAFCGVHKAMYGPDGKQVPGNAHRENEIFGEYSPNVNFSMYITNPGAHRQFNPGKMYYVDFAAVPEPDRAPDPSGAT